MILVCMFVDFNVCLGRVVMEYRDKTINNGKVVFFKQVNACQCELVTRARPATVEGVPSRAR